VWIDAARGSDFSDSPVPAAASPPPPPPPPPPNQPTNPPAAPRDPKLFYRSINGCRLSITQRSVLTVELRELFYEILFTAAASISTLPTFRITKFTFCFPLCSLHIDINIIYANLFMNTKYFFCLIAR
jgi:hypothetical protein